MSEPIKPDDFKEDEWLDLKRILEENFANVFTLALEDEIGIGVSTAVQDDAAVSYARRRAGELVTQIQETTRKNLNELITRGIKEGWSPSEMKANIQDSFSFSSGRSKAIARTEMGYAYNAGQYSALKGLGVGAVTVLDGHSADTDFACTAVDGMNISIDLMFEYPLQHVNCVRSFVGVVLEPGGELDLDDAVFIRAVS